uniref:Uncharacterized protein n=1 Tax=Lactuca sativa TaxID=4236 RepID=A0A9R1W2V2_LACSA|nr:hypothetical protein LSAT_V11C300118300 [Lactuca sativa]
MTWKTSLLLKKGKNGPPLGFKNLGEFLAQQDKKSDCLFYLLEKRIVRSFSIDSTLNTPGKIIGGLKVFAEHFRLGSQKDAHEFLRHGIINIISSVPFVRLFLLLIGSIEVGFL